MAVFSYHVNYRHKNVFVDKKSILLTGVVYDFNKSSLLSLQTRCINIYIYIYIFVYTYIYIYIYIFVYIYIYIYIYIYMSYWHTVFLFEF